MTLGTLIQIHPIKARHQVACTEFTFRWKKGKGYRAAITYAGAKMACPPPAMAAIRGSCLARFPSLGLETGTGGAGGQGDSPDPRIRLSFKPLRVQPMSGGLRPARSHGERGVTCLKKTPAQDPAAG